MVDDIQNKAADLVKRILTVGVGAIFLTEESLRNLVSDIKIPKELWSGILDSAAKTKNDFLQKLSSEAIERITSKVDPKALLEEFLANHEVEFRVRVRTRKRRPKSKT